MQIEKIKNRIAEEIKNKMVEVKNRQEREKEGGDKVGGGQGGEERKGGGSPELLFGKNIEETLKSPRGGTMK